nr:PQQ-binding-like beta-propeller repeat protein [Micromonospora sp. DSM 115978]
MRPSAFVVADGLVVVHLHGEADPGDARMEAFDAVTGARQWEVATPYSASTPVVDGGRIMMTASNEAGDDEDTQSYDLATGSLLWNTDTAGSVVTAGFGRVYLSCADAADLCALDAATGAPLWTAELMGGSEVGTPSLT